MLRTLSTSFVDDGICDCCDGSDETPPPASNNNTADATANTATANTVASNSANIAKDATASGTITGIITGTTKGTTGTKRGCENTCAALGHFAAAAKMQQLARYRLGAQNREHLIASAGGRRREWAARTIALEAQIADLKPTVAAFLGAPRSLAPFRLLFLSTVVHSKHHSRHAENKKDFSI